MQPGQAAGAKPWQLAGQRDRLLVQLAGPLLQGPGLPALEPAWRQASADRSAWEQQRQKIEALRTRLWPEGRAGWLRVATGYSVAACVLLLVGMLLWPRGDGFTPGGAASFAAAVDAPAPTVDIRATGETLVVTEQPRLVIDAEGHTAHIRRVAFTRDGRH